MQQPRQHYKIRAMEKFHSKPILIVETPPNWSNMSAREKQTYTKHRKNMRKLVN